MKPGTLITVIAIMAMAACASANEPEVLSTSTATVTQAKQYLLRDEATGREYVVRVAEPAKPPPAGHQAPVIYVLDGNWYFGMATDIARMLSIGTETPAAAIVAIGYTDQTFAGAVKGREHDMMYGYFSDRPEVGGGGAAFQNFLVNDLRPFIEQRHGFDPQRAYLAGQSLGGQFTANILLKSPQSFAGYLIGSPSLWADSSILPAAQNFTDGGNRRVMIGVGQEESPNMRFNTQAFAAAISRPNSGLAVVSRKFENQHHMSMQAPWFAEGFRYLLDGSDK